MSRVISYRLTEEDSEVLCLILEDFLERDKVHEHYNGYVLDIAKDLKKLFEKDIIEDDE